MREDDIARALGARSWRVLCASWCATERWPRERACPPHGRSRGISRSRVELVVETYAQLLAEGYLVSRAGAGTYVAAVAGATEPVISPRPGALCASISSRGAGSGCSRGRCGCARCVRCFWRRPPARSAYPDVRGALELRRALTSYLRRVRGVVVEPDSIVVCSGATQGLALLGRALAHLGVDAIAVEDPSLPPHRAVLAYAGLDVRGAPVDEQGLDVQALCASVVLTTPAHQCPTGVVLSPARRGALIEWARAGGLVIEDDYDAEFRYDRAPLGALQGLAPDRVVYLGTASKTLAPGLRLGWLGFLRRSRPGHRSEAPRRPWLARRSSSSCSPG